MKKKWKAVCITLIVSALLIASISVPAVWVDPLEGSEETDAKRIANAALIEEAINEANAGEGERVSNSAMGSVQYQADKETASAQSEALFTTVDLMDATIPELQAEMEAGNLTAAQLTQMYIDRINAYDEATKLNSIISINPRAIDDARALDRERSEGSVRGPLHGIPIKQQTERFPVILRSACLTIIPALLPSLQLQNRQL